MPLFKLKNVIQNYSWGSKKSISDLFGVRNAKHEPQAELWMGAHPNGCSKVAETGELLSDVISQDNNAMFGSYTTFRFGELPFLLKVLAAESPLSIQVHPCKEKAQKGFERENKQGIPIQAANRNYKDANHKPEMVYALTFYKAMNGFRPIDDIIALFEQAQIDALAGEVAALKDQPNTHGLKTFFSAIMSLQGKRKEAALSELYQAQQKPAKTSMAREAMQYSIEFTQHYKDDIGLFAPFMLNTIELAPGEAMFLHSETPHAYVKGTGLEIMASSDNVLRAGLTSKYIDVPELINNTKFTPIDPDNIKLSPILKEGRLSYPIPVDDFGFDILSATDKNQSQFLRSAEILFCIEGRATVTVDDRQLSLKAGESVFISYSSHSYQYQGNGVLARAYN